MLPLMYAKPRPAQSDAMARARLEQMGLGDRLDHGPQQLSGGQQQRVAIARALVNSPQLLLADEPTGALDSKTSEAIMQVFAELNRQGMTIVLVTHDADVAHHARRRILFRDGKVVEDVLQAPRESLSFADAGELA
jgi:putative ABC transport system ATP-binding protein